MPKSQGFLERIGGRLAGVCVLCDMKSTNYTIERGEGLKRLLESHRDGLPHCRQFARIRYSLWLVFTGQKSWVHDDLLFYGFLSAALITGVVLMALGC